MPKINQLKLQQKLFNNHQIATDRSPAPNVHQELRAKDNEIRYMRNHCMTSTKIANRLNIPQPAVCQYLKYHHIYCKPKHIYYQEHMNEILPYLKRYRSLLHVCRKLNLPYSSVYAAYTEYTAKMNKNTDKPSDTTNKPANKAKSIITKLKNNHRNMISLKHDLATYRRKYHIINRKYTELVNLLNQYVK